MFYDLSTRDAVIDISLFLKNVYSVVAFHPSLHWFNSERKKKMYIFHSITIKMNYQQKFLAISIFKKS